MGTAMAALYLKRQEDAVFVNDMRTANQPAEQSLIAARGKEAPMTPTSPWWKSAIVPTLALLALMSMKFKFRQGSLIEASRTIPRIMDLYVSPLVEELIKFTSPATGLAMASFEFWMNYNFSGSFSYSAPALGMHLFTLALYASNRSLKTLCQGLALHIGYNHFAYMTQGLDTSVYNEFEQIYKQGETYVSTVSAWSPIPPGTKLPSFSSFVGQISQLRGKVSFLLQGKSVSYGSAMVALSEFPVAQTFIYPVLITSALMFSPSKTPANLMNAVVFRIHNDPFVNSDPAPQRWALWDNLTTSMVKQSLFDHTPEEVCTIEQAAREMGKKGERILRAHLADERGEHLTLYKKINVKCDETIPMKMVGGQTMLKPRAIVDLHPAYHSRTTQWSRALADCLHNIWNENQLHEFNGIPVCIIFCSGYNGRRLTTLSSRLNDSTHVTILVSGDDTLISLGPLSYSGIRFIEWDASMFDQSQDQGPLYYGMNNWMAAMGAPKEYITLLQNICAKPYRAYVGELEIRGKPGWQMSTGITATTILNSVNSACAAIYCMSMKFKDPALCGRKLGFTLKIKTQDELYKCTFLKGWWLPDPDGHDNWVVLPSLAIKLGKIMNDPVTITRVTRHGKAVRFDSVKAVRIVAKGLSLSYGHVPTDYPIFGSLLKRLGELGLWHKVLERTNILSEAHQYKTMPDVLKLDRDFCEKAICERYNLELSDLRRADQLIAKVTVLPAFLCDPVFERLREVDYE